MTRRCTVCSKYHKGGLAAHKQVCRICGGDERVMGTIEEVNPQYICDNGERHEQIKRGYGDPLLIAQGSPAVVRRTKKPGKAQTQWIA